MDVDRLIDQLTELKDQCETILEYIVEALVDAEALQTNLEGDKL